MSLHSSAEFNKTESLNDHYYDLESGDTQAELSSRVQTIAFICKTPVAVICLDHQGGQWTTCFGTRTLKISDKKLFQIIRDHEGLLEIADLRSEPELGDSPLIRDHNLSYVAGIPLITSDGRRAGALAVMDTKPANLSSDQIAALKVVAMGTISILELTRKNTDLQQLLTKAEKFQDLFNNSNEIHCITDHEGKIEFINESVLTILGFSSREVLGKNIWEFSVPGERDRLMPGIYEQIGKGKSRFDTETRVITKAGRIRWFSWSNVIKDGHWLVNGRDITKTKENELQLQTLSLAVEKSSVGVLFRNEKNEVLWMNEAFEKMFGYPLSELKGKKFGHLLIGEGTDRSVLKMAEDTFIEKKSYQIEILLYRKDGSPVWMYLSNTPLYHDDLPERWVCVAVDINERKKAELALVNTRDEAIKLSLAKENFLSVMSHEMRTPLNAVIGITNALIEESPQDSQRENLDILKFSSQNLLTLINDVLDFTKIETGNLHLEFIPFNLKQLVHNTLHAFQYKSDLKQVQIKSSVDPRIPEHVTGDPTRLYQILNNLLSNAVKFTEKGHVSLNLDLVEEDDKMVSIAFAVSDTGIGIPADKLEVIFEAYEQAGSETSRKYGGTGLGLAITKKLVELFQSRIVVQSELGKGSTFSFTLQLSKPLESTKAPDIDPREFENLSARVLLVDDNAMNRLIGKKVLQKWGIDPDFAENGKEALEKIHTNNYDLVFMDIQMPVMDGFEAVRHIRGMKEEKYQQLPIIALTASSMPEDEIKFREAGMNDFILKPFEAQAMYKTIAPYLNKN